MRAWSELRLGLSALGYSQVIWTHLHCVTCGVFKLAITEEMDVYACPQCSTACKVNFVAQGFTKHALPPPERITAPLSAKTREELMRPDKIIRVRRHPRNDGPRGLKLSRGGIAMASASGD
jgi:hypothetical protein